MVSAAGQHIIDNQRNHIVGILRLGDAAGDVVEQCGLCESGLCLLEQAQVLNGDRELVDHGWKQTLLAAGERVRRFAFEH